MRGLRALRDGWLGLSGRRRPATQADVQAWTVGKLLLELPRCGPRVRLLWPQHDRTTTGCEWIVPARDLADWIQSRPKPVVAARPDGVRRAFHLWLQAADDQGDATTDLPEAFRAEVQGRYREILSATTGDLRCVQCQAFVASPWVEEEGRTQDGAFTLSTTRVCCERGHDLFREDAAIKIHRGASAPR